jgi:hypothetical protein
MVLSAEAARAVTGPAAVDGIAPPGPWQDVCRRLDAERRAATPWLARDDAA